MKKTLLTTLAFLLLATGLHAQIDTEPANNTVPGDILALPVNNNATLTNSSDVDYFRVTVNTRGVLVVTISGTNASMKARVEVYNSSLVLEGMRDALIAAEDVTLELLTKNTGNYYVKVSNANTSTNSSPYNLNTTLDVSDTYEYNDEITEVSGNTPIQIGYDEGNPVSLQGKIRGYKRYLYNFNDDSFNELASDEDIYKINVLSKGVLVMNLPTVPAGLRMRIELYSPNASGAGVILEGMRDASSNGSPIQLDMLTKQTGTYYVKILNVNTSSNGNGNTSTSPYTLQMYLDTIGMEYNDVVDSVSAGAAVQIGYNESSPVSIQGKIRGYKRYLYNFNDDSFNELASDEDIYKINVPSKGVLVMNLPTVPAGLRMRIELYSPNAGGAGVILEGMLDAASNGSAIQLEMLTKQTGTYYVKLTNVNGINNGSGNTSVNPYTLQMHLDTIKCEYNDEPSLACKINASNINFPATVDTVKGKIRGYKRVIYNFNDDTFSELIPDADFYEMISCGSFSFAKIFDVPSNLRIRITAYEADGTTVLGSKTASVNGDTVRLNPGDVSNSTLIKYFRIDNINNDNSTNTSPNLYSLVVLNNCTATGIRQIAGLEKMKVGPNPFDENVSIQFGRRIDKMQIRVTDVSGRIIKTYSIKNTEQFSFRMNGNSGLYFLQFITEDGIKSIKILKK